MMAMVIASAATLAYIYGGYYLLLRLAVRLLHAPAAVFDAEAPPMTVLITVRNEEAEIRARVQNALDCDYPAAQLEVLVASDGSTDATDSIVAEFTDPRVKLLRVDSGRGKSAVQNAAVRVARGDIIVFTDAGTRFAPNFLREIAAPFASREVGGVDGHLQFIATGPELAQAQSYYWRQELRLRELESALGLLAVSSGACLAVRIELIRPLPPSVGEDCVVPLEVVRAGRRMVHASGALAYDRLATGSRGEFRSRVRMTLRNWQGTWLYPDLLNPVRHPQLAWALWSHKLLRWMSPLFVLMWVVASFALAGTGSALRLVAVPAVAFVTMSAIVIVVPPARTARGWRIAWSFLVANAGFALGVTQALTGKRIVTYRH